MKALALTMVVTVLFTLGCSSAPEASEQKDAMNQKADEVTQAAEQTAKDAAATAKAGTNRTTDSLKMVECTLGSDVRTVQSVKTAEGGCDVEYTKQGTTNTVGHANNDLTHCAGLVDKISGNLSGAGFTCN